MLWHEVVWCVASVFVTSEIYLVVQQEARGSIETNLLARKFIILYNTELIIFRGKSKRRNIVYSKHTVVSQSNTL